MLSMPAEMLLSLQRVNISNLQAILAFSGLPLLVNRWQSHLILLVLLDRTLILLLDIQIKSSLALVVED